MGSSKIHFLTLEEVLYIHSAETSYANHETNIRDIKLLESAVENARLIYENGYVTDIFELASSYIKSITMNHPFIDGNKRTALAAAAIFLYYNGYTVEEEYNEEFANKIIDFINRKITQIELTNYLKNNSKNNF